MFLQMTMLKELNRLLRRLLTATCDGQLPLPHLSILVMGISPQKQDAGSTCQIGIISLPRHNWFLTLQRRIIGLGGMLLISVSSNNVAP
jgi:hypothetical protein